jgi:putative DNA-invertase from lambdoid prophage Rac
LNILMAIAEFERSIIQERVCAGLRAARANGVRLGRPSTLLWHQPQACALHAKGVGVRAIARKLQLSPASVHKLIRTANVKTNNEL